MVDVNTQPHPPILTSRYPCAVREVVCDPVLQPHHVQIERTAILRTLRENGHNRSETARVLGISRRALLYKIRRYADQGYAVDKA